MIKKIEESPRGIALEILLESRRTGDEVTGLLRSALMVYAWWEDRDRAFLTRLTESARAKSVFLDAVVRKVSKVPPNKLKPCVRFILHLALTEIYDFQSVPDGVSVNEYVSLLKAKGFRNLAPFVNAILRRIVREKESLKASLTEAERLALPEDLLGVLRKAEERLHKSFLPELMGEKDDAGILHAISYRIRPKATEDERACLHMDETCVFPEGVENFFYQKKGGNPLLNPLFTDGSLTVQDLPSVLLTSLPTISDGIKVLDLCASPGGKSFALYDRLSAEGKHGEFVLRDVSERKMERIEEGLERLQIPDSSFTLQIRDASEEPDEEEKERYDLLIADLPCSALGNLSSVSERVHAPVALNIPELSMLQKRILRSSVPLLKRGGELLYSTCTLTEEENEEQIAFLKELGLRTKSLTNLLPKGYFPEEESEKGYVTVLPFYPFRRGFFMALLEKE